MGANGHPFDDGLFSAPITASEGLPVAHENDTRKPIKAAREGHWRTGDTAAVGPSAETVGDASLGENVGQYIACRLDWQRHAHPARPRHQL